MIEVKLWEMLDRTQIEAETRQIDDEWMHIQKNIGTRLLEAAKEGNRSLQISSL